MVLLDILSFSCSMLPVCVILNCVNSASKFPTVFRKVANVFDLLGVRERGSTCSDIRRVSVVPLSTLDVSVISEISLSCTTSSLVVMSLSSSASQPSHFVKKFDKPLRNKEMFFELGLPEDSRLFTIDSSAGNSSRLHSANFFP